MSHRRSRLGFCVLAFSLGIVAADPAAPQDSPQRKKGFGPASGLNKFEVVPHWFADDTKFWYRTDTKAGVREFILVDAEAGRKAPAFDHAKLAAGLSKAANAEFKADR